MMRRNIGSLKDWLILLARERETGSKKAKTNEESNEVDTFGQYIVDSLKKLEPMTRHIAEHKQYKQYSFPGSHGNAGPKPTSHVPSSTASGCPSTSAAAAAATAAAATAAAAAAAAAILTPPTT